MRIWNTMALALAVALLLFSAKDTDAQQAKPPTLKYVLTYQADLQPPQAVSENLLIYNVTGGWLTAAGGGKGTPIQPCGDWLSILPEGALKLDVRCSVKMEDDSIILLEYTGRIILTEAGNKKFEKGELITANDAYFITSPTFRTTSKKYGWMNHAVFVNKMVEIGPGGSYVKYDTYQVMP